ncbi:hypothetical protein [Niabella drilacis]|uniref:Pectate lyase superfamily protein n=1 Tax=Niabella drilacis (strain DSM 25811 / CCM 8410 / CCUG 62505 / LMG 26954 / E90) TaxID=1285928 RepID=A0A1G6I989_NIADE|nr:hypothetical protein [Niabella drilacis]SDC03000.1 hypothetical protein SAMN04487894_101140 [Niabella drilacis]
MQNDIRQKGAGTLLALMLLTGTAAAQKTGPAGRNNNESRWVHVNAGGQLEYATTSRGDRIMDFSYAGYKGGGIKLPEVKEVVRVKPVAGDNTPNIQNAIDSVAKLPQTDGFRGAVVLAPGEFSCAQPITIHSSGIVLRGSGTATKIQMTGAPHVAIRLEAPVQTKTAGGKVRITDAYIPSGTDRFTVADATAFTAGDLVLITKPITPEWVRFMGMDTLVRDGKKQTWITGELSVERTIKTIKGNRIIVDVPLTDNYDAALIKPGATIQKIVKTGGVQNAGIEYLEIDAPEQPVTISQAHHSAIRTRGLTNGWIRCVQIRNTVNSVGVGGKQITVTDLDIRHTVPTKGSAKPADLSADGAQLLFNRCTIRGDNVFFLATGAKVSGPIVLLHCRFTGNGWVQPHQRWATGLLVDACEVPDGGIDFMNRGEMGSGHGWAIGWAVAWNCRAKSYLNQQPPGAYNWVIGSTGERQQRAMPFNKEPLLREGVFDAQGIAVAPGSLYLGQLQERMGQKALKNIGYEDGQFALVQVKY